MLRTGIGIDDVSGWSEIQLANGSIAYVASEYLTTTNLVEQKAAEQKAAYEAKSELRRTPEIDLAEAKRIEDASWEITQTLTQDYTTEQGESVTVGGEAERIETEYQNEIKQVERSLSKSDENEFWEFAAQLSPEEDTLLSPYLLVLSLKRWSQIVMKKRWIPSAML